MIALLTGTANSCQLSISLQVLAVVVEVLLFTLCTRELSFYRAMLCIRGTSMALSLSVRLSLTSRCSTKRLNVGSHKQHHWIAQGL